MGFVVVLYSVLFILLFEFLLKLMTEEIVVKINSGATELNLELTQQQQQQQHFSFPHPQITDNQIGAEGGKAIAEALKTNTSLTWLDLSTTQQ